jgi:hypothetical protein
VREVAQKALEEKRAAKEIGSSLEAAVVLRAGGDLYDLGQGDQGSPRQHPERHAGVDR